MTFGDRFKKLRIEKGLKQQELADEFNKIYGHTFSKSAVSQYENNKRLPETKALANFASYFGVSVDYLLCIDDDEIDLRTKCATSCIEFFKDDVISKDEKYELFMELNKLYLESLK